MAKVSFNVNIVISPAGLAVVSDPLNVSGTVGSPLTASLTGNVTGGTPPYSAAVTAGTLPPGLALDATGDIAGTPTTAGTTTVSVTVSDSGA